MFVEKGGDYVRDPGSSPIFGLGRPDAPTPIYPIRLLIFAKIERQTMELKFVFITALISGSMPSDGIGRHQYFSSKRFDFEIWRLFG
ncbi:MAG: hypothetical protein ABI273_13005 [Lacunisphaera sp.]